ncbi:MAG: hypothetical protein GY756_13450 [bacterium]|nr:hypothetical protein [bacterium]
MHYYFELRSNFYNRERDLSLQISINEIKNLWNVTHRNVQYRLKKLQDLGFINYNPGNGRGTFSEIVYYNHYQQDVFNYVETLTDSKSFGKIFELFDLPIPSDWILSSIGESQELQNELNIFSKDSIKYSANLAEIDNINPFLIRDQHGATVLTYVGDTLLLYDEISKDIKTNIVHHWKPYNSFKNWIFHIRKGIKFHNNQEMKASDVVWSIKQYNKNRCPPSWVLKTIKEIRSISDYKFEIELEQPIYWLDRYLAWPNLVICQNNTGIDNQLPILSGAYKLLDVSEKKIILESNKQYFNGQVLIDKVEISNTIFFKKGGSIALENTKIRNGNSKKIIHSGVCMLCFNFRKDTIIQNKYFREAIKYILDYEKMRNYFPDRIFEEAATFSSRNWKQLEKKSGNIASLLKKSGYKGEQLIMHCLSPKICGSSDSNFTDYFDKKAKKYGINLCIKIVSLDDYIINIPKNEADMFYGADTPFSDYWTSFVALFRDINCLPSSFLSKDQLSIINDILDVNPICLSKADLEDKIETVEDYIRSENLIIFLFHRYLSCDIDNELREFSLSQLGHPQIKKMWIDD